MGSLQRKSDAILEQHASSAATWLDALIATSNHDNIAPCDIEPARTRLQAIPFDAFLSALERARPTIDRPTEIAFYERWIEANTGTSPLVYAAWFNLGVLHAAAGNQAGAASAYGNTLTLRPDMHGAAINLGLLLERSGQPEQALATWKRATQPDDVRLALEIQQGRLLEKLGRFDEAETILRRTLLTDPAQPDVIHHWVHIRQKSCKWPVALPNIPDLAPADLLRRSGPLGILALTDDIELQREAAAAWVQRKTTPAPGRLAPPAPYPHQRIRIGYMSSDFCSHAMSYLITELFERHDRTRFEVYGYDASNEDGTDLRKRVLAAFDHHRPIHALSDDQAAQLIRNDEIDILIDLNGITDGSRVAILRWKPAPIQATYLGFIGPLPMPELDYLLCEKVVTGIGGVTLIERNQTVTAVISVGLEAGEIGWASRRLHGRQDIRGRNVDKPGLFRQPASPCATIQPLPFPATVADRATPQMDTTCWLLLPLGMFACLGFGWFVPGLVDRLAPRFPAPPPARQSEGD
jgi:tetratricopeptide (TPR) repeat protein